MAHGGQFGGKAVLGNKRRHKAIRYDAGALTRSNTVRPDKIKCNRCLKVKGTASFAQVRLDNLQDLMRSDKAFDPTTKAYIPCAECSGLPLYELECSMCGRTKAKSAFAKSQWRKHEKAECMACVHERRETEPAGDLSDQSSTSTSEDCDTDDSDDSEFGGGGSTMAATFSLPSITNDDGSATGGVILSGHGSMAGRAPHAAGTSTLSNTTTVGSGGGTCLPPHQRHRAQASSVAGSTASTSGREFAKVKAFPTKLTAAHGQTGQKTGYEVNDDIGVEDSSDDDSE